MVGSCNRSVPLTLHHFLLPFLFAEAMESKEAEIHQRPKKKRSKKGEFHSMVKKVKRSPEPEPEKEEEVKLASQESGVFPAEPQPETPPHRSALLDPPGNKEGLEEGEIPEEKAPPIPKKAHRQLFPKQNHFLFPLNERATSLQTSATLFLCGNCVRHNHFNRTVLEKVGGRQRLTIDICERCVDVNLKVRRVVSYASRQI